METIKERVIHVYRAKAFEELFAEYCFDIPVKNVISIQYRTVEYNAYYFVWYKE